MVGTISRLVQHYHVTFGTQFHVWYSLVQFNVWYSTVLSR